METESADGQFDSSVRRHGGHTVVGRGLSPQQKKEHHDETSQLQLKRGKKGQKSAHGADKAAGEKKRLLAPVPQRHHGLWNQGATCYLNSVLQLLLTTPGLESRLDSEKPFDKELRKLLENLDHGVCETRNITRLLEVPSVFEQRDAAECLDNIFQKLSPRASEIFRATLTNTTKCRKQHEITVEGLQCWSFTLPLICNNKDEYDVRESVTMFFQPKHLSKVFCPTCREKTEATRECELMEAPENLIVLLARFDFNDEDRFYVKSSCEVIVPTSVMMKEREYKLCGMVDHSGSLAGGHYMTIARSRLNQTWYRFNDSHVTEVSDPYESKKIIRSRHAYLLKYRDAAAPQSSSAAVTATKTDNSIGTNVGRQSKIKNPLLLGFLGLLFLGGLVLFVFLWQFNIL